jgi:acyl-homoserine lactone acylase PvdQ
MDRRTFLKTTGVAAGGAAVGAGLTPTGGNREVVTAADLPEEGIELLTDEYGVTHVYGEDIYSIGYGQGYAQARDRLFQLDLLRLIGRGESANAIGPSQVSSDIEVKRDLYTEAELRQQWESVTNENRQMIQGYADGVNHKMAEMQAAGELPGEFTLLGRDPGPWEPIDTVALISYFVGFFGVSGGAELSNSKTITEMFDRFGSQQAAWEAYHDINKIHVPEYHYGSLLAEEVEATDERALDYDEVPEKQLDAIRAATDTEPWGVDSDEFDGLQDVFRVALGTMEGFKFGSNAVIVGGEHTESGRPLLGGGPQMGLLKPPVMHEIGLHGAGFEIVGAGVAGTPGIIVGRTPDFAWTATSSREDMIDTIAVDLDPDDHSRYRWDGEFHEFVIEEYTHRPNLWAGLVDGSLDAEAVEQEVAYVEQEDTRMPVVAYNEDADTAFVKRVAPRMEELGSALEWLNVGRASSREEFEDALADFPFGFNFLYADDEEIASYRTGKMPARSNEADPRFPVPEQHHEWSEFTVGLDLGANAVDPERGYVVNWNNSPAPGWRDSDGEFEFGGLHRVDVLEALVRTFIVESDDDISVTAVEGGELPEEASGNLTFEDIGDIMEKAGVEHPFAPQIVPHLVAAARASDDEQLQAMADELEAWAGAKNVDRWTEPTFERWFETEYSFRPGENGHYPNGGMAIYEQVRHALNDLLFADTLGDQQPDLEFDPTAGSALSGSVDPHVADHGPDSTSTTLLNNALLGRTNFEWLADHGDEFQMVNEATGEAMALDTGSSWWEWLWAEDEIRQRPPEDSVDQVWQVQDDGGNPTFTEGEPRELRAQTGAYAAGLDGPASEQGARVSPTTPANDPQRFEFRSAGDGTYRVCNTDSGLALAATEDGNICQEPRAETPRQRWTVRFAQSETSQDAILREAMKDAAETLTEEYGSESPGDWLLDNRESEFFPLGGANSDRVPMTNRSSFVRLIAMREDRDRAESVLPPSNTGHLDTWDLLGAQFGEEPDRLTRELQHYIDFEHKSQPLARHHVEQNATDSTDLG